MFFDNNLRVTYLPLGEAVLWCGVEKVGFIKTFATGALGLGESKKIEVTNPEVPLIPLTLTLSKAGLNKIDWLVVIDSAHKETAHIKFTQSSLVSSEKCVLTYQGDEIFKTGRAWMAPISSRRSKFDAVIESKPPFAHSAKVLEIRRDWSDTPSLTFGLTSDPLCNSLVLAFGLVYDHEHLKYDSV